MMYVVAENLQFDLNFESRFGLRISELKLPRVWNALANSSPLFGQFIQRVMNALRTAARRCAHASLFLIRPPSSRMHTTAYAPPPAAPAGTTATQPTPTTTTSQPAPIAITSQPTPVTTASSS